MARLDYLKHEIEVEDDLLRGIILMVSRNYVKEAEITTETITLQECSWVLNTSIGILDDLLEKLIEIDSPLNISVTWKLKLDGKDVVISKKGAKTGEFKEGIPFYTGLVTFEKDLYVISTISDSIESIRYKLSKLKKKIGGPEYLGIKSLLDGNILDYLTKIKYILDKCKTLY